MQNDMSTAMIPPKSKPEVEIQYGGRLGESNGMSSQSLLPHCRVLPPGEFNVMISELRATLQGAATGRIECHDRAMHIAGCKNSLHHTEKKSFFATFYFLLLMQFRLRRAAAFVSSPIHLFCTSRTPNTLSRISLSKQKRITE